MILSRTEGAVETLAPHEVGPSSQVPFFMREFRG